jgi:hypothetical protein
MIALYQSHAASQFILSGNVGDRFLLALGGGRNALGGLTDFLARVLLPRFDVVLSYDLGNGLRVESGGEAFAQWPAFQASGDLPRAPRPAIETLTHYFRYNANLGRLGKPALQVGCWLRSAHLIAPATPGGTDYDLSALALLMRDWAGDALLGGSRLVTCLIADSGNDLHPLLVNNPRAARITIPLPTAGELRAALELLAPDYPTALAEFAGQLDALAAALTGSTLAAVEHLLKLKEYHRAPIRAADLVGLKKELVEREAGGLIEFVEPRRTLDDFHAPAALKDWLRQDLALWRGGDLAAAPMGYLICGPVGTGKTFLVECLAGEAGIPVVKIKNFRDKWVGSTEANLEKIFRLLHGLDRCYVFIDEADGALGRRDVQGNDGGLGGRVYAMFAKEMSEPSNRGRIVWVLASSRPDLIEVDLKRPGRVDVKLPLFPTATPEESFALLAAVCARRGIALSDAELSACRERLPVLLTPGAAEALALKIYRTMKTQHASPGEALSAALTDYQHPVPLEILRYQIGLAVAESSDQAFVPLVFRAVSADKPL